MKDTNVFFEEVGEVVLCQLLMTSEGSAFALKLEELGLSSKRLRHGGDAMVAFILPPETFSDLRANNAGSGGLCFTGNGTSAGINFEIPWETFEAVVSGRPIIPQTKPVTSGHSRPATGGGGAAATKLLGIVETMMKSDPKLTYSAALKLAQEKNRDLALEILDQTRPKSDSPTMGSQFF